MAEQRFDTDEHLESGRLASYEAEQQLAAAQERLQLIAKMLDKMAGDECCSLCGKTRRLFDEGGQGEGFEAHVTRVQGVIVLGNRATGEMAPSAARPSTAVTNVLKPKLERAFVLAFAEVEKARRELEHAKALEHF